jgi:hypothetical protein
VPSIPSRGGETAIVFTKLETTDGTPATRRRSQPSRRRGGFGDTIPLGPGRALRVVGNRVTADDETAVLIVEYVSD